VIGDPARKGPGVIASILATELTSLAGAVIHATAPPQPPFASASPGRPDTLPDPAGSASHPADHLGGNPSHPADHLGGNAHPAGLGGASHPAGLGVDDA
jgi:hypothetical protein